MGAATYRIGPSDFFTPGDLQADAQTLDAQVATLDSEVEGGGAAPPAFVDQWTLWLGQWRAFRDDHFGGWFSSFFSSLNDANRDDLIRFENQYGAFAQRAASFGADVVAPVGPSSGSQDTLGAHVADQAKGLPSISTAAIVTVAVAAVVVIIVWRKA